MIEKLTLIKGRTYEVTREYDWLLHSRAEYHSTFPRECDGVPLHNMIIRMYGGDLEMVVFTDENILSESEEPV